MSENENQNTDGWYVPSNHIRVGFERMSESITKQARCCENEQLAEIVRSIISFLNDMKMKMLVEERYISGGK